ncbi:MAG: hypothetical protein WA880_10340 [Ornithinimicrobium sp.]
MSQPEGQKRIVSDASDITGVVNPEAQLRGQSSARWLGVGFILVIVGQFFRDFLIENYDTSYESAVGDYVNILSVLSVVGWLCVAVGFWVMATKIDSMHRKHDST